MDSTLKDRIRKRIEELRLIEKIEEEELRNERKEENNKRHEDLANEELDIIDSSHKYESIEIDNLDQQLNTNSQEMEGSSPSTEESTNKGKEQKSASPSRYISLEGSSPSTEESTNKAKEQKSASPSRYISLEDSSPSTEESTNKAKEQKSASPSRYISLEGSSPSTEESTNKAKEQKSASPSRYISLEGSSPSTEESTNKTKEQKSASPSRYISLEDSSPSTEESTNKTKEQKSASPSRYISLEGSSPSTEESTNKAKEQKSASPSRYISLEGSSPSTEESTNKAKEQKSASPSRYISLEGSSPSTEESTNKAKEQKSASPSRYISLEGSSPSTEESTNKAKEQKSASPSRYISLEDSSPSTEESTNKAKEQKSASPKEMNHIYNKPNLFRCRASFLDYTDDDDDDDDDDDIDDDLIHTAPVLLKSIQEITSRPSPEPKLQNLNSSIDSSYSSPLSQKSDIVKTSMKSKFCLDNLLTDHTEMKEFEKICNEVKTDMKNDGAFINMLNKEEEEKVEEVDLGEEKRLILKQMTEVEEEMPEDRPGFKVMDLDQTCSMFDESIHPCHCGFTVGENGSTTECHIHGITRERYLMLVESDILSMCFARITCQDQLMRWLFFLMSVDDNFLVRQGCRKTILKVIHQQQVKGTKIWSPTFWDFITVLCNYGAALQTLLPKQLENDFNTIELENQMFKQPNRQSDNTKRKANEQLVKEKLEMVLEVLGSTLLKNREAHPSKELSLYIAVICRMSLDPLFKDMYGVRVLQDSIDLLIENYSEQDWPTQRIQLIRMLSKMSDHHHDMTYICKLLPVGARGLYVQRRVAYLALSTLLLNKKVDDSQLQDFTIKDLYQFVPSMMSLLNDDLYYKLSSIIVLMDLCVASNHSISSQDREDLKRLIELVKKVRVKENVALMNRSKINDILVRTTSGWTLDIQTFKGKQTKIYEYACYKSPVKYRIEQLEQHKSDSSEASDNDDDDDDDDDDDQPVPTKLPKLDMVS